MIRKRSGVVLLLLLACAARDPVTRTVHEVAEAAEDRDAAAVVAFLDASYKDANGGRAEAEQSLRRYFFAYRSVDVAVRDLETRRTGSTAAARFRVDFSGVPKTVGGIDQFLPRSASYLFDVFLVEQNGEWKFTSAHWQQIGD
jgi:hypothetical protein